MKQDLSALPMHIIKTSKNWFQNTKTGQYIKSDQIEKFLPKPKPDHETIISKRFDLRQD